MKKIILAAIVILTLLYIGNQSLYKNKEYMTFEQCNRVIEKIQSRIPITINPITIGLGIDCISDESNNLKELLYINKIISRDKKNLSSSLNEKMLDITKEMIIIKSCNSDIRKLLKVVPQFRYKYYDKNMLYLGEIIISEKDCDLKMK